MCVRVEVGVRKGVREGTGETFITGYTESSEKEAVIGAAPLANIKNPSVPLRKVVSRKVNCKWSFRKKRISLPAAQTPSLTSAGAAMGASPLDNQVLRGTREPETIRSRRVWPSQLTTKR